MAAPTRAALRWEEEVTEQWVAPEEEPASTTNEMPAVRRTPRRTATAARPAARLWLLRLLLYLTAGLTIIVIAQPVVDWARIRLDDLQYGRPRTSRLAAFVGHDDADGMPTQFYAINLNRRITIIEIPGGDPSRLRTIPGPYLVGRDEDLTVATLRVQDVNGDGHPDLLVRVKHEELVYVNDNGSFRLMTRAERPVIERSLGGAE